MIICARSTLEQAFCRLDLPATPQTRTFPNKVDFRTRSVLFVIGYRLCPRARSRKRAHNTEDLRVGRS